jgi:chromosome segregation ATPase
MSFTCSGGYRVEELVTRIADLEKELREAEEHISGLEGQLQEVGVKVEEHKSAIRGREDEAIKKAEKARELQEEVVDAEKDMKEEFVETSTTLA